MVEWQESASFSVTELAGIHLCVVKTEDGDFSASLAGAGKAINACLWFKKFQDREAAKSAALAEARRMLRQALGEMGDE